MEVLPEIFSILYKEDLYAINFDSITDNENDTLVQYGNPMGNVLIIYHSEQEKIIGKEATFLTNILKAVHVNDNEVGFCNLKFTNHFNIEKVLALPATKILTFGVQRKLLPEFLTYGALHYLHGKKIITSPDLMVIEPDATYKSVLWNQLKLMFGIK